MAHAKHQHYVARLYLRQFACESGKNPRIWMFDKHRGVAVRPSIKNVAGEMYFYEQTDTGVERMLQSIEEGFVSPLRALCGGASVADLTAEDRARVAIYLAVQHVRTPEFRHQIKSSVDGLRRWAEHYQQKIDSAYTTITEEQCREIQVSTLADQTPDLALILVQMKWVKLHNQTSIPFWTSDHPVSLFNPIYAAGRGNLGLLCRGIQVSFPLSPLSTLCLCDPVEYANLAYELPSDNPEHVMFQNHLQLRASTRFVFSRSADFAFAAQVLRDQPELADPYRQRVRIAGVDSEEIEGHFSET